MSAFAKHVLLLFSLILPCTGAYADGPEGDSTRSRRWYLPHYVPLQFAGNIGLFSTGAGFTSRHQNYHLDLLYGYVPKSLAGVAIHTVTAKNYFPFGRFTLNNSQALVPYLGLGISVEVGGIAFFEVPDHFPDSYYDFPKNLHALAYGGVRFQHRFEGDAGWLSGMDLYVEAGSVDVYIWYKTMSREISLREIFSLAFGVNFLLAR